MVADIFADSSQQNDRTPIIFAEVEVSRISTTGAGLEIWSVSDQSSVFCIFQVSLEPGNWPFATDDIRFHVRVWEFLLHSFDFLFQGRCGSQISFTVRDPSLGSIRGSGGSHWNSHGGPPFLDAPPSILGLKPRKKGCFGFQVYIYISTSTSLCLQCISLSFYIHTIPNLPSSQLVAFSIERLRPRPKVRTLAGHARCDMMEEAVKKHQRSEEEMRLWCSGHASCWVLKVNCYLYGTVDIWWYL